MLVCLLRYLLLHVYTTSSKAFIVALGVHPQERSEFAVVSEGVVHVCIYAIAKAASCKLANITLMMSSLYPDSSIKVKFLQLLLKCITNIRLQVAELAFEATGVSIGDIAWLVALPETVFSLLIKLARCFVS